MRERLDQLTGNIPVGMELNTIAYQSDLVNDSVEAFLINLVEAVAIVIANMVGTGIFTTSGFVIKELGSPMAMLFCWAAGGVFALWLSGEYLSVPATIGFIALLGFRTTHDVITKLREEGVKEPRWHVTITGLLLLVTAILALLVVGLL